MEESAFWGMEITPFVQSNVLGLIPLKSIHSTLLYITPRTKSKEGIFKPLEGIVCNVYIYGYRYSEFAMIFLVDKITRKDNDDVIPSFSKVQHITLALKEGIKARDSIKLTSNCPVYPYQLVIESKIKRYIKGKI